MKKHDNAENEHHQPANQGNDNKHLIDQENEHTLSSLDSLNLFTGIADVIKWLFK